jgi:hypothetical protein
MARPLLGDRPFRDLGPKTMKALEEAGHEVTVIATVDKKTDEPIGHKYYINRDALCFLTNRSSASVDYWIATGKIKPGRKFGNYSLFLLQDVAQLLETGDFPKQNVETIYQAGSIDIGGPLPQDLREAVEEEQQALAREKESKASRAPTKRGKRQKRA